MEAFGDLTTLGSVVARTGGVLQTGPFGSQLHASDYRPTGTPLIMPVNLGENEIRENGISRIGDTDVRRLHRHALREGDIVFSRRGDVGRRSIVRRREVGWLCGTGCLAARFGSDRTLVNPAYVAEYLGSSAAQSWLIDNAVGGTMPNLNTSILAALPIWLPSRPVQDRIVTAIDDIRRTTKNVQELINKKRAIKHGLMQHLLTGAVRLPGFTDAWQSTTIGDIAQIAGGGTPSRSVAAYWGGTVPWATIKDVSTFYPTRTQEYVTLAAVQASAARLVPAGTVVLAARMLVGKAVRFDVDVAINQDLKALFVGSNVDSSYLRHWFDINGLRLAASAGGSTVAGTSTGQIRALTIELPSVDEQRAIAQVLDDSDEEIEALARRLDKASAIKIGLMQQLLTGRIRLSVEATA
ncbi:hypothetical protein SCMU_22760 [Sinomonas cyclohexanicum]|uniref:Type I restriction modification DNA specificity domain-containing protein n=2 Tax=Sinomonas cyclohexanicum TaxID=322009 RepID=A0ABN6FIG8_SINCY|nr:hypothetical protein SCMU_22760 [Corynebacterium cyclohexanicum]